MSQSQRLIIHGGKKLEGSISVQGAKNSVLPLLAATVLCHGETTFLNCPRLTDADAACRILGCVGCKCRRELNTVSVRSDTITETAVPDSLMREMRSSIVFLGAIIGRTGHCKLSFPGGCELGPRPIDLHISSLKKLGIQINEEHGYLDCTAPRGIKGGKITLSIPSVGATENAILAAALANGDTEIHNAAREPEIVDLIGFINRCGGKISGGGTSSLYIHGVTKLDGAEYHVMPDRIVAATYLCCGAITRGELVLSMVNYNDIAPVVHVLEQMGCSIYAFGENSVYLNASRSLVAPSTIRTSVHPGFPTDAQPLVMALATTVRGTTVFVETIFENRYKQVNELIRLGARVNVEGRVAVVEGVGRLSGAELEATDLRGGAALVTAGLFADGITKIGQIQHIDRGYEEIEKQLRSIGADIKRTQS